MTSKFKRVLAISTLLAMCGGMLSDFTEGRFGTAQAFQEIELPAVELSVKISEENFPDKNFRSYVKNNFDKNNNGYLEKAEIMAVKEIDVYFRNISSMKGVEYFKELTLLDCSRNDLTSLDISNITELEYLFCNNNKLESLDVSSNSKLNTLYCYSNKLESLDVSNNAELLYLDCSANKLTSLDVSNNPALSFLGCESNVYDIELNGGKYDLSKLPEDFDISRASDWSNASVDGTVLTVSDPAKGISYSYDIGGGRKAVFTLNPVSGILSENMVSVIKNQVYTGKAVEPELEIFCGDAELFLNEDYTVVYKNNVNVGTAQAVITATGGLYEGEVTVEFTIEPMYVFGAQITLGDTLTYNGKKQTQVVESVVVNGITLTEDDYTVTGNTAVKAGDYLLTITGKGNFTGTATAKWSIEKEADNVEISKENFPDNSFRSYVKNNFDKNNNGYLEKAEIIAVNEISVNSRNISDLKGVEYFKELTYLDCSDNKLESLDIRKNTELTALYCYYNKLESLDVSKNTKLIRLYCDSNKLESLDVSNNAELLELFCENNLLESLGVNNNSKLTHLYCYSNKLESLELSNDTGLLYLFCDNNNIKNLDISNNTALTYLNCNNNNLTRLDISNNTELIYLYCNTNKLTSLDVSNNSRLIDPECRSNTYDIGLTGDKYDLSELPRGFDINRTSEWSNASVDGTVLTVSDLTKSVSYSYDIGGGMKAVFTLNPVSGTITENMVSVTENHTYTGKAIEPGIEIFCGNKELIFGEDYTVVYKNNVNAGTAQAVITAKGDFYRGEVTVEFTIDPVDVSKAQINSGDTLTYNGTEQTQTVESVVVNSITLTEEDYDIKGNTAVDAGDYILDIIGKGNFTGTASAKWSIEKAVPEVVPVVPEGKYTKGDNLPEIDYKSSITGSIAWLTELSDGLSDGENELVWEFVPEDTDNYKSVTGTIILEVQAKETTDTIISLDYPISDYDVSVSANGGFILTNKHTGEIISLPGFLENPLDYDFIYNGESQIPGGGSREVIEGTSEEDNNLSAGNGFNVFYAGEGDDTINGGADIDFMYGENGNDRIFGGNGVNIVFGRDGNDTVYDGEDGSYLDGGAGDDMIYGGGGADVLDGGAGNDYLQGDHGNNTYVFGKGYNQDTVNASSGLNTVVIHGYEQSDMINTCNLRNDLIIRFVNSDDCLIIERFFDYNSNRDFNFVFDNGTVLLQCDITAKNEPIDGTDADEWLAVQNSSDAVINGNGGNDGISGGSGNDALCGGPGDDTLYGNDGDDVLDGGTGSDVLNGGNGSDKYIWAKGYGRDTVNEWGSGCSTIELSDIRSDEVSVTDQWGSDLVLSVSGTEDTLIISNFKWGQEAYTFKFADGVVATVNKDTWTLEFSQFSGFVDIDNIEDMEHVVIS
ncbi:MAG: hypothetical protein E7505_03010 [Ruminococcus sp.]|nr:hypothetical protein [Ruminococcus sp.]